MSQLCHPFVVSRQLSDMVHYLAQLRILYLVTDQTSFRSADTTTDHISKDWFHMCMLIMLPLQQLSSSPSLHQLRHSVFSSLLEEPGCTSTLICFLSEWILVVGRQTNQKHISLAEFLNRSFDLPIGLEPCSSSPYKISLGVWPSSIPQTWPTHLSLC